MFAAGLAAVSPTSAQLVSGRSGADLVAAVRSKDGGKVTSLLESNPMGLVNARGDDGDTGLVVAIKTRNDDFAGFLLNKGADPNLPGKGGETPLIAAARAGSDTAIGWLLESGAKVDGINKSGETALIVAVQQRDPQIVRLLLSAGANPDKADGAQGFSARDYATRDPRARDILKIITDRKPKP